MVGNLKTERLRVGGMTCVNCQTRIEKALRGADGVKDATVSFAGGYGDVTYDADILTESGVRGLIERAGYEVLPERAAVKNGGTNTNRVIGFVIIIAVLYFFISRLNLTNSFPLAEAGMGYGMLFVIGLLTSVHCIAMCGGINLSQCIPQTDGTPLRASALYNIGRVVSYTVVGFIVGGIGGVITPSGAFKGAVQIIAGVFMVIMGVNMLGIFPWLRIFTPRMPSFISRKINAEKGKSNSPLIVGLLNGLMPCGPLQAMQIYALSTGSPIKGAAAMLLFSLGTVPLMFGLGAASSLLTKKFTQKVMTVGAVFVTVLGLTMFTQGAVLSGFSLDGLFSGVMSANNANESEKASAIENTVVDGVQLVSSTLKSGSYPKITVQAGIPVKWTIDATQGSINGCNKTVNIPEYGIQYSFTQGENVIEFTPERAGKFGYSCWMGMIRGTITVTDGGESAPNAVTPQDGDKPFIADVPAIPTDNLAIAEPATEEYSGAVYEYQTVTIALTDTDFSPAVAVVRAGTDVEWIIDDQTTEGDSALRVPLYNAELPLNGGENALSFAPEEDFQFGNGDDTAFGYVKVVDDINAIDAAAIKAEVAAFAPIVYPQEQYEQAQSGGASCH